MGRNRDALPTEVPKQIQWDDPEICPYYLVCFCPHELFVNTKADLGTCSKFHDEQLRTKYLEEAPSYKRSQFEKEFIRFAEKMISDIEGKIKRGKMRIALANGPDGGTYAGPGSKNAERIALLSERINALLEEAEAAGCEGDVEKAQGIMKLCDQIKDERDQLKSNEVSHPWNPDKAMQVCEVCGSYLIIGEAQHRLDDHIMGKQHVGFAMLRKNLEDVRKSVEKRETEEREEMDKERERRLNTRRPLEMDRKREEKDSRRGSDHRDSYRRDRDRSDRDKDRKRRSRSRSRDKDKKDRRNKDKSRDRKRDSSRDKKRHSDDKRRSRRSRSGSGSRNKNRDRKRSRSRSRDRKDRDRHSHRRHRDKDGDRDKERGRDKEEASPTEDRDVPTGSGSPPEKLVKLNPTEELKMDEKDDEKNVEETSPPSPRPDSPKNSGGSGHESPPPGSV